MKTRNAASTGGRDPLARLGAGQAGGEMRECAGCAEQTCPLQMLAPFRAERARDGDGGSRLPSPQLCWGGSDPQPRSRSPTASGPEPPCTRPARNSAGGIYIHLHPRPVTAQGAVRGYG